MHARLHQPEPTRPAAVVSQHRTTSETNRPRPRPQPPAPARACILLHCCHQPPILKPSAPACCPSAATTTTTAPRSCAVPLLALVLRRPRPPPAARPHCSPSLHPSWNPLCTRDCLNPPSASRLAVPETIVDRCSPSSASPCRRSLLCPLLTSQPVCRRPQLHRWTHRLLDCILPQVVPRLTSAVTEPLVLRASHHQLYRDIFCPIAPRAHSTKQLQKWHNRIMASP